jgi:hypothetical protein
VERGQGNADEANLNFAVVAVVLGRYGAEM